MKIKYETGKNLLLTKSFVLSILFIILTLKFTSIGVDAIPIYFAYFTLTSAVLVSILAVIKNKKSKSNQYGLLATIDALMAILSFIFAMFGIIHSIKNIACIIFVFTFIMLPIFCGFWSKYEKNEK